MKKPIYAHHIARDVRMDSIGVPINPNRHAEKTLWQEFWTDFLLIFVGLDDIIGIILSVFIAVMFVIKWGFFLVGRFVLRMNLEKPKTSKNK